MVPPKQFDSFCALFDVALYRDTFRLPQNDCDKLLDRAIEFGLEGNGRGDLEVLRNFLNSVFQGPDPSKELEKLWKASRSRIAFLSGPAAPTDQPAIVQVFTRVLKAIEKKIT
jgi:hypothetical protein